MSENCICNANFCTSVLKTETLIYLRLYPELLCLSHTFDFFGIQAMLFRTKYRFSHCDEVTNFDWDTSFAFEALGMSV